MPEYKQFLLSGFYTSLLFLLIACGKADEPTPTILELSAPWQEATPASVGMDVAKLDQAAAKAQQNPRFGSLLVVRHGKLVFEEYFNTNHVDSLNDVRSVTKSVVATLTSIALKEGFIGSLDETIADYLPTELLPEDPEKHQISIRHLLTMSSGFSWPELGGNAYNEWITSGEHLNYVLTRPLEQAVGTTYNYNSGAVFLLGVILEFATGMELEDFADQFLFDKIGIESRLWENLSDGFVNGGAGLDLRPRDLARLGQLYLQNGRSGDMQLLSDGWVDMTAMPAYTWRFTYGAALSVTYGHLWWLEEGQAFEMFFAWGYGGQYIFVIPELDMVVVSTTNWRFLSLEGGPEVQEQFGLDIILNDVIPAVM